MAIAPGTSTPASSSTEESDFGANDWLLEEMYERFTADPSSVDASWADYFAARGAPGSAAPAPSAAPASEPAQTRNGHTNGNGAAAPVTPAPASKTAAPRDPAATPTSSSGAGAPADDPVTDRPRPTREQTPDQPAPRQRGRSTSADRREADPAQGGPPEHARRPRRRPRRPAEPVGPARGG